MDFDWVVVLGALWVLFNLVSAGRKGERPSPKPRSAPPSTPPRPGGRAVAGGDATQREGSRLEQLLRELERNLEQVGGTQPAPSSRRPESSPRPATPARRTPAAGLPGAEEVEDRRSFDEEPVRVVSLEQEVRRPQRLRVDHDDAAEELVRRRIEAAQAWDRGLTKADHDAFDSRIRQEPADHTAVRKFTPAQLRDAIVWREILGPPVSEREEGGSRGGEGAGRTRCP